MTKIKDKLPTIPSELLQVALDDMKVTIASGHKVNMDYWGVGIGTKDCTVCFAGGVMLNSLKLEPCIGTYDFWYEDVSDNDTNSLSALNEIRSGYLETFLNMMLGDNLNRKILSDINICQELKIKDWVDYEDCDNNEQFYNQIEFLITFLKSKEI